MVEIFLRLPLDSILSCKLVSKVWKNLIEDSVFFKLYKVESTTIFLQGNALYCLFRRDDTSSYTVRRIPTKLYKFGSNFRRNNLYAENSNKIACVKSQYGHFDLYNLLTGDLRVVNDAPYRAHFWSSWRFYGFGYDSHDDDYKILVGSDGKALSRLQNYSGTRFDHPKDKCLIFVYSYRNSGWKLYEGFPNYLDYQFSQHKIGSDDAAYCFNGHLHWFVIKEKSGTTPVVAALDVHDYKLIEFALPPPYCVHHHVLGKLNLTEFDGCLCCARIRWDKIDVWVMKEYGDAESWTKLFSICLSGLSNWSWVEKMNSIIKLYKCEDERKIMVFMQDTLSKSDKFTLLGYDLEHGELQVFPIRKGGFVGKLMLSSSSLKNNTQTRF